MPVPQMEITENIS